MNNTKKIELKVQDNEYWYGGFVCNAHKAPYGSENYQETMVGSTGNNQACPFLISTSGRYIWSEEPFNFEFIDGLLFILDALGQIKIEETCNTLKGAYLDASKKYFPPSSRYPDELNFTAPQANSWIELTFHPTQDKVMKYADQVLASGLEPGVMMIDNYWYKWNGNWKFDSDSFPDARGMIQELHRMGFQVILWISPFLSPDTNTYRILREKDCLIKNSEGEPSIQRWWDGYSACYDLTNPEAKKCLVDQLDELVEDYGVDGFKFDAGDAFRYNFSDITYKKITPNAHCEAFASLGLKYRTSEYRACWKLGGQHLIQRTRDKDHVWEVGGLADLIPSSITQGLMGYPYNCPDMIGGGLLGAFEEDNFSYDQELYIRWLQCSLFFPIIQFSALPANCLDAEGQQIVKNMMELRKQITPYILEKVKESAVNGEPILRPLEYNYPGKGYGTIVDQYMIGDKYLVAPVLEKGALSRKVKFPPGKWKDESGKVIEGGDEHKITASLETLIWYEAVR